MTASASTSLSPVTGRSRLPVTGERALEVRGICKSFGGVAALSDVTMTADVGHVVGLVGENGAGKSTLLKIVSGNLRRDSGSVLIRGEEAAFRSYREATEQGVFHVYQDLALVHDLTIDENLFLAHETRFSTAGVVSGRRMRRVAREVLEEFGHGWIDASRRVGTYDFATRQAIEIVKAFALASLFNVELPILLLDEPTAGLGRDEVELLMAFINRIRDRSAIIFVSHRLAEVTRISDRIYVLLDGSVTAEVTAAEATEDRLHELMVGRKREELFYRQQRQRDEFDPDPALEVEGLCCSGMFSDVGFSVRRGEIVGLAGLLGSGKSYVGRAVFGALPGTKGEVRVGGQSLRRLSIGAAIEAGVGYVPPDRHGEGIILPLPVGWNITLSQLASARRGAVLDLAAERADARETIDALAIKARGEGALAWTLSGGNQQKVVLGRWLLSKAVVLILDNPTQGVDAGAREEIYDVLRSVAAEGVGILLISDDLPELIGLSNRLLIMRGRALVGELDAPRHRKPEEVDVVAMMT